MVAPTEIFKIDKSAKKFVILSVAKNLCDSPVRELSAKLTEGVLRSFTYVQDDIIKPPFERRWHGVSRDGGLQK